MIAVDRNVDGPLVPLPWPLAVTTHDTLIAMRMIAVISIGVQVVLVIVLTVIPELTLLLLR